MANRLAGIEVGELKPVEAYMKTLQTPQVQEVPPTTVVVVGPPGSGKVFLCFTRMVKRVCFPNTELRHPVSGEALHQAYDKQRM